MAAPFKAYDIRGIYNENVTEELAYKVGYFLVKLMKAKNIIVGRDVRVSSESLYESLTKGILDAGADVLSLGLSTTPMVYFSTVHFQSDASVQITASHNPAKYNGFKISAKNAIPVGYDSGLSELEKMCLNDKVVVAKKRGDLKEIDAKTPYLAFLRKKLPDISNLKIAVDCSLAMANLLIKDLLKDNKDVIYINDHFDGSFKAHEPNPLDEEARVQITKCVLDNKCDLGIIYDGDADRVAFIDEKGVFVQPDFVIALLGKVLLEEKGDRAVVDIRTSKSTTEYLEKLGYQVLLWKVGHVFAKQKIRETGAVFGGELAGHYYFKDFFSCDSAMYTTNIILDVVSKAKKEGKSVSLLMKDIIKYHSSGEINFKIEDKDVVMQKLYDAYAKDADKVFDFDGFRIEYPTWWFNVRKSNTEPYLRLVLEAQSDSELKERISELKPFFK